ncbi:hypothetical protein D9M72_605560 [compost metagenome]
MAEVRLAHIQHVHHHAAGHADLFADHALAGVEPMLHHGELDAVGIIQGQVGPGFSQRCQRAPAGQRLMQAGAEFADLFALHGVAHSLTQTLRSSV